MKEVFKEYAEAIYSLAAETGSEDEYLYGMRLINSELQMNPEYVMILDAPSISKSERLSLVEQSFGGRVHEHVLSLFMILCERGYPEHFGEIYDEFAQMYLYFAAASKANVTSAVPLTDEEKDEIQKKLEKVSGGAVAVNYIIDPQIIGGVIAEVDGKVIDGSLRRRLKEIKEVIKQ